MTSGMMRIEVNEMKHAFRVNGVTFSRKRLLELFPMWGDKETTMYRFLVIAPFLAETKEVEDAPTEQGRYAIYKAKRLHTALGLDGEDRQTIPAFMMAAAQMGELPVERIGEIATAIHDSTCGCGVKKSHKLPAEPGRVLH